MKPLNNANAQPTITLFSVIRDDGKFFAGFDPEKQEASFVDNVFNAKLFTDKFGVSLRPSERLVEVQITMTEDNVKVSNPFRPRRRFNTQTV